MLMSNLPSGNEANSALLPKIVNVFSRNITVFEIILLSSQPQTAGSIRIPSFHEQETTIMTYDINTIYTKYKQLTKKQRQQLLTALQSQGINIVKIEAYEYADAPGIKHLFFYFAEDSKKAIPYFMLDKKVWEKLQLCIMSIA